jgi:pimeloyl-ACP methyl ester carboxylesterase
VAAIHSVRAGVVDVAFERHGPRSGWPAVLLHGFPYDQRCYDGVVGRLVDAGADVVVPYLRGYGPTRFADEGVPRSGQQAALAHDLAELIGALALRRPVVAGFDWGGRAACVVAALWPGKVSALVTVGGYNVLDVAGAGAPRPPDAERRLWYQYYLHGERGRAGLARHRRAFARLLWQEWSPTWTFTDADFEATATSFDNPDFTDVVVHSYRHRYGLVAGDPAYQRSEELIAARPPISVPTVVLDPTEATLVGPALVSEHRRHFTGLLEHHQVKAGHDLPQEAPAVFAQAVESAHRQARDDSSQ